MGVCSDCEQDMETADSCTFKYIIGADGKYYERSREHFGEPSGRCGDCGIKHGGIHHYGCDVERCPKCGGQLITCDCWPAEFQVATDLPS